MTPFCTNLRERGFLKILIGEVWGKKAQPATEIFFSVDKVLKKLDKSSVVGLLNPSQRLRESLYFRSFRLTKELVISILYI